jgi:hypothetical protein
VGRRLVWKMKDTKWIECEFCGGEAAFIRDIDPFAGYEGDWTRISHDCDSACKSHPDIDPTALTKQLEEEEVGRSEKNFKKQFADYHGANTPQTPTERAEVERRDL